MTNQTQSYEIREKVIRLIEDADLSLYDWNYLLGYIQGKLVFNSQVKKDNSDSSNENYLETRSKAEEDNKSEHMSADVDNQPDVLSEHDEIKHCVDKDFEKLHIKGCECNRCVLNKEGVK